MAETAVPKITPSLVAGDPVDLSRVHFVGVGGTGMLPLARVCVGRGFAVSGSDAKPSAGLSELERLGARVHVGHSAAQVPADATAVVFTHAVAEDNPEIRAAHLRGIPLVHRSAALNVLMSGVTAIGVLGTHGKTSTAGMLSVGLTRMEHAPTYVVGGELQGPASGGRSGDGGFFVAEVDESDRSHLGVRVDVAVITDIGHDHPECYAGEQDHVQAYESFVRGMPSNGLVVLSTDAPAGQALAARLAEADGGPRLVTVGTASHATWRLTNAVSVGGSSTAMLHGPGGLEMSLKLRIPGVHQLRNAAAAVAAVHALGLDHELLVEQLGYFDGVARRMSMAGEAAGVRVYDSYAHHPAEVTADLAAARTLLGEEGRVIAVFQPTGQARLDAFGAAYGTALAGCDQVVLTDSTGLLRQEALEVLSVQISRAGGTARAVERDRAEAVVRAARAARPGDVVVLIGTGDLVDHGSRLTAALSGLVQAAA
ncbi:UDP-N-acetylmuramate--L-alanine ligase [Streptomyces poonensis]|uniref:UDP-N-acetylmuramate--L-alanine ligase n=1 Tax=Streptomyces poonensis TaxID=68255 RepID=A0A918PGZ3_9ACTN|nr:Mur ligase domain-containing protein [Streptomyces poonensis]GGZ05768.1 UDP-N-acetylmuramate--L-alanine ligase [Streptomyces poonensis]GLJ92592.1 UDP-N-acetylmuramate--L-alanine ligase [Streptomyces poonensis]